MPVVKRKYRGNLRRLLERTSLHLVRLIQWSDQRKAKHPEAAIFTDAEKTTLQQAFAILDDKAEEVISH